MKHEIETTSCQYCAERNLECRYICGNWTAVTVFNNDRFAVYSLKPEEFIKEMSRNKAIRFIYKKANKED
jgi:hypothetical protein